MGTLSAVRRFIGDATPTPENRWTGTNRGGYMNSAWDDIGEQLRVTLDGNRQIELERELVRIFSTELPVLPIYYEVQVVPTAAGLTGVQGLKGIAHTGHVMHTWNVHEWDLQR
jgi:peptide/nickel transport system substrate-binding protein